VQERTYSGEKSAAYTHDWHQLLVVLEGALAVHNDTGVWTTPRGSAAWVPRGSRHAIAPLRRARVRTVYVRVGSAVRARRSIAVLALTPLARALVDHCATNAMAADAASRRLVTVLMDQVQSLRELPMFVPALTSPLTRRVADALDADPDGTARIADLAATLGISGRTLERAFVADASMSIGEWRQRRRLCHALTLLTSGMAVKDVALEIGYETPSAFVTAFKKMAGTTPGRSRH
jgi:AraC-like DNA-binding protein